jgi:hypothetical protein
VLAQWGGLFIKADPYTNASTGLTNIHAALFADSAVLRPASFAAMKDALTA